MNKPKHKYYPDRSLKALADSYRPKVEWQEESETISTDYIDSQFQDAVPTLLRPEDFRSKNKDSYRPKAVR